MDNLQLDLKLQEIVKDIHIIDYIVKVDKPVESSAAMEVKEKLAADLINIGAQEAVKNGLGVKFAYLAARRN